MPISELSHHELAWKKHLHQAATIPYDEAFGLVGYRWKILRKLTPL